MAMTHAARIALAVAACGALAACASTTETGDDCVSHYASVTGAPTWQALEAALAESEEWGRVASVRTNARGDDVGAGDQDAVRVVDLLDRKGRRLVQVDVWRTESGGWRAGDWSQCID